MRENTKVTKSENEKALSIIHELPQKFFQGGNVDILFFIFKVLTISVPSKIILN